MELTERQKKVIQIVKECEPISGDNIAKQLGLTKPTLRSDLSLLTMTGILDARPRVGYIYSGQTIEPLLYEELFHLKIGEIMVPPTIVNQTAPIREAVMELFLNDTGSLYIVNDQREFVGLVSRKDLLRATLNNQNLDETPVAMIMSRMPNIITITPEERIIDAGYLIMHQQVDSLPVMEKNGSLKVIGKISKSKLLNHFVTAGYEMEKNKEK
ncbi:helix-turn-helix transcriptional regulator [Vagococcus lutrae]|uniref:Helix-turn-helix transcriptional regulator n=1 Tax=Vagococcus lutrae TaxID=81947 RepID=A0AAF0BI86_9ENTE|nr:helix-turn-helix transcriptional regulator [Vagococcus lutrae]MDO5742129.1 helix-turn-helix transcriptional regulator [Vagococcus sp.]MCO7151665.1 helix-turn-helix transcriptional regulator [Vagococcus lutrae]MDT2801618.1 helix-turn-helix transcriptional regulator [Vagococcus lutrae]MDT2806020.1 helix-turn-helix transcriptional regulator [Vagococcus lutrae]MDT2813049.1 helix-turn-helix transcriptional regulator [Vagococcus lutrae]